MIGGTWLGEIILCGRQKKERHCRGSCGDVRRGEKACARGRQSDVRPGLDGLAVAWRLTFCFKSELTTIPVVRRLVGYIARMEGASDDVSQSVEVAVGEV